MAGTLAYALLLRPELALAYFRQKGYAVTEHWLDLAPEQHARAFTVARVTALEILQDIRELLDEALREGRTQRWFRQELVEALQRAGWLPRAEEIGLLMPWRVATIFRTNLQTAYMAGRYLQQLEMARERPYWQYVAVLDDRTRPAHRALHGLVFRADDPFWQTHYPPNGFNCRCRVRTLTEREVRERGLQVRSSEGQMVTEERQVRTADGRVVRVTVAGYWVRPGEIAWTDIGWSTNPAVAWRPDLRRYVAELAQAFRTVATPLGRVGRFRNANDVALLLRDIASQHGHQWADQIVVQFKQNVRASGTATKAHGRPEITLSKTYDVDCDLLSALNKLSMGQTELTRSEEWALHVLHHEYRHLLQDWLFDPKTPRYAPPWMEMEALHDWVAQQKTEEFIKALGAPDIPSIKERVSSTPSGYQQAVRSLQSLLDLLEIDNQTALRVLERIDVQGPGPMRHPFDLVTTLVRELWKLKGLPLPGEARYYSTMPDVILEDLADAYWAGVTDRRQRFEEAMKRLARYKREGFFRPRKYQRRPR